MHTGTGQADEHAIGHRGPGGVPGRAVKADLQASPHSLLSQLPQSIGSLIASLDGSRADEALAARFDSWLKTDLALAPNDLLQGRP